MFIINLEIDYFCGYGHLLRGNETMWKLDYGGLINACKQHTKLTLVAGDAFEFIFRSEIQSGLFTNGQAV